MNTPILRSTQISYMLSENCIHVCLSMDLGNVVSHSTLYLLQLNPDSGVFAVDRLLTTDPQSRGQYTLDVRATRPSDGQTADGQIIVTVDRNRNAPRFLNTPYRNNISIDFNISEWLIVNGSYLFRLQIHQVTYNNIIFLAKFRVDTRTYHINVLIFSFQMTLLSPVCKLLMQIMTC